MRACVLASLPASSLARSLACLLACLCLLHTCLLLLHTNTALCMLIYRARIYYTYNSHHLTVAAYSS